MFGFFKKKQPQQAEADQIAKITGEDESLQGYREKAHQQMDYLIDFMNGHEKDDELFKYAVKTRFIEGEHAEHMWVKVNEYDNGYFNGVLVNHPNTMKLIKYGDPVKVKREDVDDWVLQDHLTGTKVGGFSSDYLRNKAKLQ